MIIFKKFGKKVKITNADWKKLRARFNPHKAVATSLGYAIKKACPFCKKYHHYLHCKGCPLTIFADDGGLGCENFFLKLFPDMEFETGDISEVYWDKCCDIEVRIQLYKLQTMMGVIEGLQEKK